MHTCHKCGAAVGCPNNSAKTQIWVRIVSGIVVGLVLALVALIF
jgi:hypothetical protein